jgi:hypothetical protein
MNLMISETMEWMNAGMWMLVGVLLAILAGLVVWVNKKSRRRWIRGRNRRVT